MKEGCEGENDIEWRDIRPTSLMIIYFISEANFSHLMHIDNRSWKWRSAPGKEDQIYGRWAQNVLTNDGTVVKKGEVTTTNNEQRATRQHDQHHSRCIAILEHMTINGFHFSLHIILTQVAIYARLPNARHILKWLHLNR